MDDQDICRYCGWAIYRPSCDVIEKAVLCDLNWDNRRRYGLRYKDREIPVLVKSIRYQGPEGKGDCFERLEPFSTL
jgi:hypothetical protein